MIDALMESVAFAAMFSGGMFLLAGIAAIADLVIGRPQARRPRPVEPVDFKEALLPAYKATRDGR